MNTPLALHRLAALSKKEALQILRDPSSNLIAFVLPVVMLFIFSFGINLDSARLTVGLVLQDTSPEARLFAASLEGSRFFHVVNATTIAQVRQSLMRGEVRGFVVVPPDFSERLKAQANPAPLLLVTDGSEPNTANFLESYVRTSWDLWLRGRAEDRGEAVTPRAVIEPQFWYNPSAESRNYLVPGSITIIMTVVGALLTSLVVAREWERGTMEALLGTPVTRAELLLSKLIPYYALGMTSLLVCVGVAVWLLRIPFHGSVLMLIVAGSLFLCSALGLGLLLSTATRNQFNAAMAALNAAFLPALILSGFVYEIRSMPTVIQGITYLVPARYFVTAMQTLFQAGDIFPVLGRSIAFLAVASLVFLGLTAMKTRRRLE